MIFACYYFSAAKQSYVAPGMILSRSAIPFSMESRTCVCVHHGLQIGCTYDHLAVNIVASPTSDAGTSLPRLPPLYEEQTSSWTPDIAADSLRPQANAEISCACLCPSLQCACIRSIDRGVGRPHPTNLIASIHNEGFPGVDFPDSTCWKKVPYVYSSTACETKGTLLDSAISSVGQTDINLTDVDRDWLREDVSMNALFDSDHRYTGIHATSNSSAATTPQGISHSPTVVQYQEESVSRDRLLQFQKTSTGLEKASSQSFQQPTGAGGASTKGSYTCSICGKRYVQLQGVRRHYREKHNPNSCSYCDFKWSRPYQYRAHIKKKHCDVTSDLAPDKAMWTRHRVPNTTKCMRKQPLSEAVEVMDHDPQLESTNPAIRMDRNREDPLESESHTVFLSVEECAERAIDLNMSSRKTQTWTRDETRQDEWSTVHSPFAAELPCHLFLSQSPVGDITT